MIARAAAALLLLWALGFAAFAVALPRPAGDVVTDGIVVPTGGTGRIARGLSLLEQQRAKRMLVTGVDRRVRPHEIVAGFQAPAALVECCVDLGREAVDTRSNAAETAAWVRRHKFRSIRLVTTDWHMARARFELARMVGPEVRIVPDGVRSEPALMGLLKEYNKYVLRRIAAPIGI